MGNQQAVRALRELIAVSRDSEKGFRLSAERASTGEVSTLLADCASACANNLQELCALVRRLGADPAQEQPVTNSARRGWSDVSAVLSATDDAAILEACEHCQDFTLETYRNTLDDHLPDFVRRIVLRQFIGVMRNHDRVRARRGERSAGGAGGRAALKHVGS